MSWKGLRQIRWIWWRFPSTVFTQISSTSHLHGITKRCVYYIVNNKKQFNNLKDPCKFTLLTNELKPIHKTNRCAQVPYLEGHDYVLLPGAGNDFGRLAYSHGVPECLQNYSYQTELPHPEVILYFWLN